MCWSYFLQNCMRAGGDRVSMRGIECYRCLVQWIQQLQSVHKDNNALTIRGGSVHCGDVGQLCKDPPRGILLICIYRFILSLPPKHHVWHSGVMVWQRSCRDLEWLLCCWCSCKILLRWSLLETKIFFLFWGSFGYKTEEISVKSEKRSATTKTSELL